MEEEEGSGDNASDSEVEQAERMGARMLSKTPKIAEKNAQKVEEVDDPAAAAAAESDDDGEEGDDDDEASGEEGSDGEGESEEEEEEEEEVTPPPAAKSKAAPKSGGQKRKGDQTPDAGKPTKAAKTTEGKGTPEDTYQKNVVTFLKSVGKTTISAVGSKVKRPDGMKTKLGQFFRERPNVFLIEGSMIRLKE
eukprot:Trichotokara_eunicae@DN128_c0_g1_i1.p1